MRCLSFLVCLVAATWFAPAAADFPSRTVRLVVTAAPGGAADVLARILIEPLSRALGQAVIVDNRPGGGGMLAAEAVARGAPDGHSLLVSPDALFAITPHLHREPLVDVMRQLVAVTPLAENSFVLMVHAGAPVQSLTDLVAYARRAAAAPAYGSSGTGTQHHLMMERLKQHAGMDLLHVPYKGGAAASQAVASGEVALAFGGIGALPLIRSGKVRAVAVSGARRLPSLPGVPTLAEHFPGLHERAWLGLFAPAGTPAAVLERLHREVQGALGDSEAMARLFDSSGLRPLQLRPAEFSAVIREDHARFGEIIRQIGLRTP